jgi:hypothetical protein
MYTTNFIRITEKGAASLHDEYPLTQSHDVVIRFQRGSDGKPMNAQVIPQGKKRTEPVFTLRANDKMAASFVQLWADIAEVHGGDPEKVISAKSKAEAMRRWQEEHS